MSAELAIEIPVNAQVHATVIVVFDHVVNVFVADRHIWPRHVPEIVDRHTIKLVRDKHTPEELQNHIRVRNAVLLPGSEYLHLNLECAPLPIAIAFDVFIRAGEQELKLGTISLPKKEQMGFGVGQQIVKKLGRPKELTVILRTSDHAARRSVDLYEIWDGELVFKDFPVQDKW